MQNSTPKTGVSFTSFSIRKALGACVLVSAVAFSSQLSAQPAHYVWTGEAEDGVWATVDNWRVGSDVPERRPGFWAGNTNPTREETTTRYDRVTIDGDYTITQSGNIVFQNATASKLGVFNAVELLNGAKVTTSSPFRVTGYAGVTRNVVIDANSSLTSTFSTANGLQIGSVDNNISTWTVQGSVTARTAMLFTSTVASSEAEGGGLVVNLDGGSFIVSDTTNWLSSANSRTDAIAQFNISNDGFLNLGVMTNFEYSSNGYINFVDASGEFNFLYGDYSTRESVETLIDNGYIRIGGNVVTHNLFNIKETSGGWQITTAIPEPSTLALLIGGASLAGVLVVRRRRS